MGAFIDINVETDFINTVREKLHELDVENETNYEACISDETLVKEINTFYQFKCLEHADLYKKSDCNYFVLDILRFLYGTEYNYIGSKTFSDAEKYLADSSYTSLYYGASCENFFTISSLFNGGTEERGKEYYSDYYAECVAKAIYSKRVTSQMDIAKLVAFSRILAPCTEDYGITTMFIGTKEILSPLMYFNSLTLDNKRAVIFKLLILGKKSSDIEQTFGLTREEYNSIIFCESDDIDEVAEILIQLCLPDEEIIEYLLSFGVDEESAKESIKRVRHKCGKIIRDSIN